jgi:hypothetical protein
MCRSKSQKQDSPEPPKGGFLLVVLNWLIVLAIILMITKELGVW